MLHSLATLLAPAVAERLTLLANHLLGSEAAATQRLRPHAGRTLLVRVVNWPALLPPPPPLAWRVTPAGMLEWCGPDQSPESAAGPSTPGAGGPGGAGAPAAGQVADLTALIEAGNPALLMTRMLTGVRPTVQIEGDAAFAADVNWLLDNLRWDVAGDLEGLFGPVAAQQLHQVGSAAAAALRAAVRQAAALGERWRPDGRSGPS